MSEKTELKPCPFCGSSMYSEEYKDYTDMWCTTKTCFLYKRELLFCDPQKFNTRPIEDALSAEVDRLRDQEGVENIRQIAFNLTEMRLMVENEQLLGMLNGLHQMGKLDELRYRAEQAQEITRPLADSVDWYLDENGGISSAHGAEVSTEERLAVIACVLAADVLALIAQQQPTLWEAQP